MKSVVTWSSKVASDNPHNLSRIYKPKQKTKHVLKHIIKEDNPFNRCGLIKKKKNIIIIYASQTPVVLIFRRQLTVQEIINSFLFFWRDVYEQIQQH